MKEYIDKEAFIAEIDRRIRLSWMGKAIGETIKFHIEKQPAADVVERKRGEWVENDKGDTVCSECGEEGHFEVGWFGKLYHLGKFCHDCGADMRQSEVENV